MSRISLILTLSALTLTACKKNPPTTMAVDDRSVVVATTTPAVRTVPEGRDAAVMEMSTNFQKVRFDTDSDAINAESADALRLNAGILQRYRGLVVEIQGHADERGTTDYNLALGQRRSAAVRQFLLANGANETQLRTVSYGEERPVADGSNPSAWSANRRAEFRIVVAESVVTGTVQ